MSKLETPLTRRFWRESGGTLIEEYPLVKGSRNQGRRLVDGLIIRDGPHEISSDTKFDISGKDVIVVQTKARRLGMNLLGQALFSRHLAQMLGPRHVESVAICRRGDETLEPLAKAA